MSPYLLSLIILLMLPLGLVQVAIAYALYVDTRYPKRRKYITIYVVGVVAYFLAIWWVDLTPIDEQLSHRILYYGGAGILALYNAFLSIYGKRLP